MLEVPSHFMAYATAFKLCLGNYSEGKSRNFADKCNLGLIVVIEHGGYFIESKDIRQIKKNQLNVC